MATATLDANIRLTSAMATQKTLLNLPGLIRVYRPAFKDWTSTAKAAQTGLNSKGIGDGQAPLKQVTIADRDAVQMTVTALQSPLQANGFAHADYQATMGMPDEVSIPNLKVSPFQKPGTEVVLVLVSGVAGCDLQMYLNDEGKPRVGDDRKGVGATMFDLPLVVGIYKCVFKAWQGGKVIAQTDPMYIPVGDIPVLPSITDSIAIGEFFCADDLQGFEVGGAHYMNGLNAIPNVQFGKLGLQLWNDMSTSWMLQAGVPCNILRGQWNTFAVHTQFSKAAGRIRSVWLNYEPILWDVPFDFAYTPGIMPGREKLIAEKITYQWQKDFTGTLAVANMEYRIYNRNGGL